MPIKEAQLIAEDKEVKKNILKWAKETKEIRGITCGGSGTVLFIDNDILPACLKIIRCKHCSSLEEQQKLISEILNILRCSAGGNILPILKNNFSDLSKKEIEKAFSYINEVYEKISEGIKANKTDLDFEKLLQSARNTIFVFRHNPPYMLEHTHIGYLTPHGMPVDKMLEFYSQVESDPSTPQSEDIPDWVYAYGKPEEFLDTYKGHQPVNANELIRNLIKDTLRSIKSIHESGLVHLDVKEANLLAIKSEKIGDCPKFVLFDFGSAQEASKGKRTRDEFEGTYQYLPNLLQRKNPLSEFTSHNKVYIKFSEFEDFLSVYTLDIHAVGQIIMNIVTDQRYRRLSGLLEDKEDAIAFSQLISLNLKDDDKDSIYNKEAIVPEELAKTALETYTNGEELWTTALDEWNLWIEEKAKIPKPILPSSKQEADSYPSLIHPATKLFEEEKKIIVENINKLEAAPPHEKQKVKGELSEKLEKIRERYCKELLKFKFLGISFDFSSLLKTKLIKRQRNIKQLSLSYLRPPEGARRFALHNRLDHSIGMVEVSRLYLISLLKNCGWFRYRFELEDGIFLLISALLHDVGHYPCAHYLEDTDVFSSHDKITKAIIKGDINTLWADTKNDEKIFKDSKWVLFELKKNRFRDHSNGQICEFKHGKKAPCYLSSCTAQDLAELHNEIDKILKKHNQSYKDFLDWYDELINIDSPEIGPKRLIHRVLRGILTGPIDADKIHYIVNDSINCELSLASAFEGVDFRKLLESLSIPIRHLEETPVQRFCLGLKEESAYLAELIMFIRESLFSQVYWSSFSRGATVMLRYILLESFDLIFNYMDTSIVGKFIGDWIKADDSKTRDLLKRLVNIADSVIKKEKAPTENWIKLRDIYEYLFNEGPEKNYFEICRIYPSDRAAYENISSNVKSFEEIIIGGEELVAPSKSIIKKIRDIIADVLYLPEEQLPHGAVLIDIPFQRTSKKKESSRLVLVDTLGFGRSISTLWDTIESNIDENVRLIRVFLHPDIIKKLDKEDCLNARRAIIARMS